MAMRPASRPGVSRLLSTRHAPTTTTCSGAISDRVSPSNSQPGVRFSSTPSSTAPPSEWTRKLNYPASAQSLFSSQGRTSIPYRSSGLTPGEAISALRSHTSNHASSNNASSQDFDASTRPPGTTEQSSALKSTVRFDHETDAWRPTSDTRTSASSARTSNRSRTQSVASRPESSAQARSTWDSMSTHGVSDGSAWTAEDLKQDLDTIRSGIKGRLKSYENPKGWSDRSPTTSGPLGRLSDGWSGQSTPGTFARARKGGWQAADQGEWRSSASRKLASTDLWGGRGPSDVSADPLTWLTNSCGVMPDRKLKRTRRQEEAMRDTKSGSGYGPWHRGNRIDPDEQNALSDDEKISGLTDLGPSESRVAATRRALSTTLRRERNRRREEAREYDWESGRKVKRQTPRIAFTSIGRDDYSDEETWRRDALTGVHPELGGLKKNGRQQGPDDGLRREAFELLESANALDGLSGGSGYGSTLASKLRSTAERRIGKADLISTACRARRVASTDPTEIIRYSPQQAEASQLKAYKKAQQMAREAEDAW